MLTYELQLDDFISTSKISDKEKHKYKPQECYYHSYYLFQKFKHLKKKKKVVEIIRGHRFIEHLKKYDNQYHFWLEIDNFVWEVVFNELWEPMYRFSEKQKYYSKYKFKYVDFIRDENNVKPKDCEIV